MTKWYFDEPECPECGKTMTELPGDIWTCKECEETITREWWENDCQSRAEKAAERSAESSAWDDYRAAYEDAQYRAMQVKRDLLP